MDVTQSAFHAGQETDDGLIGRNPQRPASDLTLPCSRGLLQTHESARFVLIHTAPDPGGEDRVDGEGYAGMTGCAVPADQGHPEPVRPADNRYPEMGQS